MLRGSWEGLLSTFAPRHCAGCDGVAQAHICGACSEALDRLAQPPTGASMSGVLMAAYPYDEPVRRIIARAKYHGEREALAALAHRAADRVVAALLRAGPEAVVPVPLGRRRRRRRGYNQAAVIAAVLAGRAGIPMSEELARTRETLAQVGSDEGRRQANVAGAFAWRGRGLRGRRVLLVDDVHTTGATASSAAGALREAGAAHVDVAVIAAVP